MYSSAVYVLLQRSCAGTYFVQGSDPRRACRIILTQFDSKPRFAIQFYMFDELVSVILTFLVFRVDFFSPFPFTMQDQALDSTYRAAVANLIKKQADSEEHPTQFIVSTFRPELVDRSERWFGISHQNKVSSLHPLSRKDALHFIANLMNQEEAVGEVTSMATSKKSGRTAGSKRKTMSASAAEGAVATTMPRVARKSAPA